MASTLDALARRHAGETIVVVSHADPIKAAAAHALGAHLDHFQRIVISPCSVTALLLGGGAPLALCINDVGGDLRRLRPS
jgi:probable phosphoglycerate mutase